MRRKDALFLRITLCTLALAAIAHASYGEILPGFALQEIASAQGFLSSIALDSQGRIHYSTTDGSIWRLDGGDSKLIAIVPTAAEGNAGLLGIAFGLDGLIVAHWVSNDRRNEVIGRIDPQTGLHVEIARLPCAEGAECSTEHHGGNPIVGSDGAIYVGIGDFGGGVRAQNPAAIAGKILRIEEDGRVEIFARGFRNPFDVAFDSRNGSIVASENGPAEDDEIHVVSRGDNAGWPFTAGNAPPLEGAVAPIYVFPGRTAPTGVALDEKGALWSWSLLVTTFVTKTLCFFPSIDSRPLASPVILLEGETGPLIDVVIDSANRRVLVGSSSAIYELLLPIPGDANGDRIVDAQDLDALSNEIFDGDGVETWHAAEGTYRGSWGADVNRDGQIDALDLAALERMLQPARRRGVRRE